MSDQPPPVEPLDYARPAPREPHVVAQCIATAILTIVLTVIAVFFGIIASIALAESRSASRATSQVILIAGAVVLLLAVNVLAYRLLRNPRTRGYALGIWIGLGVSVLIEGACFASF